MAFTVTPLCRNDEHVFNPFFFQVSSSNSTKLNHRFIADIYHGLVSPTDSYAGRFKFPVRPDGYGIFSPARVLESFVQSNITPSADQFVGSLTPQRAYSIKWGEEYDNSATLTGSTGVTIYSAITTNPTFGYVLNSAHPYENNFALSATVEYNVISATPILLTDWSYLTPKKIRRAEWETIACFRVLSNTIKIQTFDSGSTQVGEFLLQNGYNSGTIRYNLGIGTNNLDFSHNNELTSTTEPILPANVHSYLITMEFNGAERSAGYTYEIDDSCLLYETTRIAWLNQFGSHDFFTFKLIKRESINRKNTEWEQYLPYNYSIGDRGRTNLGVEVKKKISVTTDWLTDAEATFLDKCAQSQEHWLIDSNGNALPLILVDTTPDVGQSILTDRIFNRTFNFEYAFSQNTQRT